jgi:7-carboxy-7-deazaguanine synthase
MSVQNFPLKMCADMNDKNISNPGLGTLTISEIRGPLFNIEGPWQGIRCTLVRLFGCNLQCNWCDVEYSWRGTAFSRLTIDEVYTCIQSMRTKHVLITGGEPLLQAHALCALTARLHSAGNTVEVETNGTIRPWPGLYVDRYSVSPKLTNSGRNSIFPEVLRAFVDTDRAVFKFPCWEPNDIAQVAEYDLPKDLVYIMPIGARALGLDCSLDDIKDATLRYGFNMTDRLGIRLREGGRDGDNAVSKDISHR